MNYTCILIQLNQSKIESQIATGNEPVKTKNSRRRKKNQSQGIKNAKQKSHAIEKGR